MKAETQIKIGKLTALSTCILLGILLLILTVIHVLSLATPQHGWFCGDLIFFIGILFSLYAIFAYAITHGHKKTSVLIFAILYLVTLVFWLSRGAIEHLVRLVVAFVPLAYVFECRNPRTYGYAYGLIMPVVMCLLLCGVLGVYKAKKGKV